MYVKIPNPKGLALAKDVLAQLKYQKVGTGIYLDSDPLENSLIYINDEDCAKKHMPKLRKCEVCAKGALFLSYINKYNNVKINELYCLDSYNISTKLQDYFSSKQLDLIEAAFEGFLSGEGINTDYDFRFFVDAIAKPKDRLKIIMENVVENGGVFVPEQIFARLV